MAKIDAHGHAGAEESGCARAGTSIAVPSHDGAIAENRWRTTETRPERQPGALRGKIRMSDDFDPLPGDMLAAFEDWDNQQ